jgi:Flp pilus assembly protein TadB
VGGEKNEFSEASINISYSSNAENTQRKLSESHEDIAVGEVKNLHHTVSLGMLIARFLRLFSCCLLFYLFILLLCVFLSVLMVRVFLHYGLNGPGCTFWSMQ